MYGLGTAIRQGLEGITDEEAIQRSRAIEDRTQRRLDESHALTQETGQFTLDRSRTTAAQADADRDAEAPVTAAERKNRLAAANQTAELQGGSDRLAQLQQEGAIAEAEHAASVRPRKQAIAEGDLAAKERDQAHAAKIAPMRQELEELRLSLEKIASETKGAIADKTARGEAYLKAREMSQKFDRLAFQMLEAGDGAGAAATLSANPFDEINGAADVKVVTNDAGEKVVTVYDAEGKVLDETPYTTLKKAYGAKAGEWAAHSHEGQTFLFNKETGEIKQNDSPGSSGRVSSKMMTALNQGNSAIKTGLGITEGANVMIPEELRDQYSLAFSIYSQMQLQQPDVAPGVLADRALARVKALPSPADIKRGIDQDALGNVPRHERQAIIDDALAAPGRDLRAEFGVPDPMAANQTQAPATGNATWSAYSPEAKAEAIRRVQANPALKSFFIRKFGISPEQASGATQ